MATASYTPTMADQSNMPHSVPDTSEQTQKALRSLSRKCPHMRKAIKVCGPPPERGVDVGFDGLCRIIIDQQVSKAAGAAIWKKFSAGLGGTVSPDAVLFHPPEVLGTMGLSRAKVKYISGMAEAVVSGDLDIDHLATATDDDVMASLTALKGIGRWTAEVYLLFGLKRPDVFPSGDLALQVAAGRLVGLPDRPSIKEMDVIAETWRPHRSVAARMLWMYYRVDSDHSPAG